VKAARNNSTHGKHLFRNFLPHLLFIFIEAFCLPLPELNGVHGIPISQILMHHCHKDHRIRKGITASLCWWQKSFAIPTIAPLSSSFRPVFIVFHMTAPPSYAILSPVTVVSSYSFSDDRISSSYLPFYRLCWFPNRVPVLRDVQKSQLGVWDSVNALRILGSLLLFIYSTT